jgi:hypothetical protein
VFFDSGGTLVGSNELRRVLQMEEEVGDEGSQTKMKGFAWRRRSSSISMAPMRFRRPASDETQGSGSVEVLECSSVDERMQSGGTTHAAQGDSFIAKAVLREKGAVHGAGGSKERGGGSVA